MTGSIKDFLYIADDGANYSIAADESNVEMIMGAQVSANGGFFRPPQGFTPRKVRITSQDGLVVRVVPVLTQARYNVLTGGTSFTIGAVDSDSGLAVRIAAKLPEKIRRFPKSFDTGRIDTDTD